MELKLQYQEIDSKHRSFLENIPDLLKPFNSMSLINELERLSSGCKPIIRYA